MELPPGWLTPNIALAPNVSERMRRLCREVVERTPPGWDEDRTISIEESDEIPTPPSGGIGYASTLRDEEDESLSSEMPDGLEPEQTYAVTLYVKNLKCLSDTAVRWVVAHELGHVVSGLRTGSIVVGNVPMTRAGPGQYVPAPSKDRHEDGADQIALNWGFSDELQHFLAETSNG